MKFSHILFTACLGVLMFCLSSTAQQAAAPAASAVVPRLVNFSGNAADAQGKILRGAVGATFAIYQNQSEGAALWLETQNIQADAKGNYTVQLGATTPEGLPLDLFTSGEGRWLGVTINGGQEQPRILLLSVPYALKAADAETVGGLPPSAFLQTNKNAPPPASGTVTSVGLSAPKSDFKVSGSPVTTRGTLTLNWNVAPTSTEKANTIVKRDSTGSFAGNTITAAMVNAAFLVASSTSGGAIINGSNSGTTAGSDGVDGVTTSSSASGVAGVNHSGGVGVYGTGGVGVFGTGSDFGMQTDSNVQQARTAGGWVKAMLHFSPFNGGRIISCFNSTLAGAAATTPPCGFLFDITGAGDYIFDFGFEVDDRIYSVTPSSQTFTGVSAALASVTACGNQDGQCLHTGTLTNNQVEVSVVDSATDDFYDSKIHLLIY